MTVFNSDDIADKVECPKPLSVHAALGQRDRGMLTAYMSVSVSASRFMCVR